MSGNPFGETAPAGNPFDAAPAAQPEAGNPFGDSASTPAGNPFGDVAPAATTAPPPLGAAAPSLTVGDTVVVSGLQSKPELNGRSAKVEAWDQDKGREAAPRKHQGGTGDAPRMHRGGTEEAPKMPQVKISASTWVLGHPSNQIGVLEHITEGRWLKN